MRMDPSVPRGGIPRGDERHVAVRASLRRRRIVKRSRAFAGHARTLPVVVLVEAAQPPVRVHRLVQVHLVARRAELRRLLAVERLQERLAMRPRRQVGERVVQRPEHRVVARGKVVERRIFNLEAALSHRPVHARDRVARRARQAGLRLGRRDLLADGSIEAAVEEHRVVVAARAPLRGPRPDHVLHVLDRLAIPLVVERGEVVHRGAPLLVDVRVAAAAGVARQEEIRRDRHLDVRVRG